MDKRIDLENNKKKAKNKEQLNYSKASIQRNTKHQESNQKRPAIKTFLRKLVCWQELAPNHISH